MYARDIVKYDVPDKWDKLSTLFPVIRKFVRLLYDAANSWQTPYLDDTAMRNLTRFMRCEYMNGDCSVHVFKQNVYTFYRISENHKWAHETACLVAKRDQHMMRV